MSAIQRDVSVAELAKRSLRKPAFIRRVFGDDGLKDRNGQIWFMHEIAHEIETNLADIDYERRLYPVSRGQFAKELRVDEKTISNNYAYAGLMFDGELRFERSFVDDVLREQGDVSAYTVSTQDAAEIIGCSKEKTLSLLRGKERKIGRTYFFRQQDVDVAAKRQDDLRLVGLEYLRAYYDLTGPQLLHLLFAHVQRPGVGGYHGELRGHLPQSAACPAADKWKYGLEWRAGVVMPWLGEILSDLQGYLTEDSYGRFLRFVERNYFTEHAWKKYEMMVNNAEAEKALRDADLGAAAKALRGGNRKP